MGVGISVVTSTISELSKYPSVTDEVFNSSEYGTWVQLAHTNIVPDSEVVTDLTGTITYTRGVDYEMNYTDGKIMILSTGSMSNWTDYLIDYEYGSPKASGTTLLILMVLPVALGIVIVLRVLGR